MNEIESIRHYNIFSPLKFSNNRVDVIGAGAIGSKVIMSLAKLGIENLHVWDFDKVEDHNLANQVYYFEDIGKFKADAIAKHVKVATKLDITVHNKPVVDQELGHTVFLCIDTMSGRKEIFDNCLKYKLTTKQVVETRMGADLVRCYSFNPSNPEEIKNWEGTLYSDEESEESLCGSKVTVGPTADIISGLAVWQFIKWFRIHMLDNNDDSKDEEVDESISGEIIMSLRPDVIITRKFTNV